MDYNPLILFSKYIKLLYAKDELWEPFLHYVHEIIPDREDSFYAYNRDPECIEIWDAMLDNMGGGWPLAFFASAAYLLLQYKENGHDLDTELQEMDCLRTDASALTGGSSNE